MGLDESRFLVADDFGVGRALCLVYRSVRNFPSGPGRPLSSGEFQSPNAAVRDYHRGRHARGTVWSRRKLRIFLCMDRAGLACLVPICCSTICSYSWSYLHYPSRREMRLMKLELSLLSSSSHSAPSVDLRDVP